MTEWRRAGPAPAFAQDWKDMPYASVFDLPASVKDNLPEHAQEIDRSAFNSAWYECRPGSDRHGNASREETAQRVAWAAVGKTFKNMVIVG